MPTTQQPTVISHSDEVSGLYVIDGRRIAWGESSPYGFTVDGEVDPAEMEQIEERILAPDTPYRQATEDEEAEIARLLGWAW
jgi:hypothetical protein